MDSMQAYKDIKKAYHTLLLGVMESYEQLMRVVEEIEHETVCLTFSDEDIEFDDMLRMQKIREIRDKLTLMSEKNRQQKGD